MTEEKDYGHTEFLKFRSGRERLLHIVATRILTALRVDLHGRKTVADWLIVLWRVATLSDQELTKDAQLRKIAATYSPEYF
jgi:hypothetical protein